MTGQKLASASFSYLRTQGALLSVETSRRKTTHGVMTSQALRLMRDRKAEIEIHVGTADVVGKISKMCETELNDPLDVVDVSIRLRFVVRGPRLVPRS